MCLLGTLNVLPFETNICLFKSTKAQCASVLSSQIQLLAQVRTFASAQVLAQVRKCATTCASAYVRKCASTCSSADVRKYANPQVHKNLRK